jgi:tetratricopeptide (TPR) repeat protein
MAAMPGFQPSVSYSLSRADVYKREGDFQKAIDFLKKAQSKDVKNEAAYGLPIADCYAALKQYGKAAAACLRVLALQPKNADAVLKHGQYSFLAGNTLSGKVDLFKAIELAPANPNAYLQRGNYYFAEKQYTSASEDFKKALALDPDLVAAKDNLDLCAAQAKRAQSNIRIAAAAEAESAALTKAEKKEIAEGDVKTLQTKGYEAIKAGRGPYAVAALSQAVKLDPNNPSLRRYLSHALVSIGDGGGAVQQFRAWMKLERVPVKEQIAFTRELSQTGDAENSKALFTFIIASANQADDLLNLASNCAALHFDDQARAAIAAGLKVAVEPQRSQFMTLQAALGKGGNTEAPHAPLVRPNM